MCRLKNIHSIMGFSSEGNINYTNSDRDRMICLDTLAAYYVQEAKKEKNKEKKKEMFTKVQNTLFFNALELSFKAL